MGTSARRYLLVLWIGCDDGHFSIDDEQTQGLGNESEAEAEAEGEQIVCAEGTPCGMSCCVKPNVCRYGACIPVPPSCVSGNDCQNDRCCTASECIPFGVGPCGEFNASCSAPPIMISFAPEVQCSWTTPVDASNGAGSHAQVMSTPVVVDFDFDDDPETIRPSIVFSSYITEDYYSGNAVLRVIDGATCTEQYSVTGPTNRIVGSAPVAVGDIDLDGRADIVASHGGGGVVAFRYDALAGQFVAMWRSHYADGSTYALGGSNSWGGPSIYDLDNVEPPEILFGAVVISADGLVLTEGLGLHIYVVGQIPVVADVDLDGAAELVYGDGVWEFSDAGWTLESYYVGTGADGFTAIGDFGDFGDGPGIPEIVVISSGTARLQRITGEVVFGPLTMPGMGTGGPPTVADFDGDGEPEFASVNGSAYSVFDLECSGSPLTPGCALEGVRWWQPAQDMSSNMTGSSVFDFEGDGAAEAVYADECFLRVYDGLTGAVEYSHARSSCTTYENPVIADVDGDFNSEIVTSVNETCGSGIVCPATDPLFPSAAFWRSHGIDVYRDTTDLWVNSRPVWNQHAYSVTNVLDDGTVPALGDVLPNWLAPSLNNFRQNVPLVGDPDDAPDLTIGGSGFSCGANKMAAGLYSRVCNRGTLAMAAGVPVAFYVEGMLICQATTIEVLEPGTCEYLMCAFDPAVMPTADVVAVVDDNGSGVGSNTECLEDNNRAVFPAVTCVTVDGVAADPVE